MIDFVYELDGPGKHQALLKNNNAISVAVVEVLGFWVNNYLVIIPCL